MSKISIHYLERLQEGAERLEREGKVSTIPSAELATIVAELIGLRARCAVIDLRAERKIHGRTNESHYSVIDNAKIKIAILEALVVDGPCKCGCGRVYKSRHHLFMHQSRSQCGEDSLRGRQVAAQCIGARNLKSPSVVLDGETYVLRSK